MRASRRGLLVALVHVALVLAVAGTLVYERATLPRAWVESAGVDPDLPIRGRYVSLDLLFPPASDIGRGSEPGSSAVGRLVVRGDRAFAAAHPADDGPRGRDELRFSRELSIGSQSLTDALTIRETAGRLEGLRLAFLGKVSDAMASSVALTCSKLGVDVVLAGPSDHQMAPEMQALVRANCAQSGASLTLTDDAEEAVADADFVYTVLWWWLEEGEAREALRRTYAPYQVNEALWAKAKPGARFMDCLPAVRNEEATDAIMDGPMTICFDQSENRKHLQKAVLLALIGIDDLPSDSDLADIGRALLS